MLTWPNWVDLVVVSLVIRTSSSGFGRGIITEILDLLSSVSLTVLTVSYWAAVVGLLQPVVGLPSHLLEPIVFWALFLISFVAVRMLLRRAADLIKWEKLHWLLRGLGLALGALRGIWWAGFILLALATSGFGYLERSVQERSVLGPRLLKASHAGLAAIIDRLPSAPHQPTDLIPPLKPGAK